MKKIICAIIGFALLNRFAFAFTDIDPNHWGYNAVLVCFDTSENLMDLLCTVDYIKASDMKVVIVYTGGSSCLRMVQIGLGKHSLK